MAKVVSVRSGENVNISVFTCEVGGNPLDVCRKKLIDQGVSLGHDANGFMWESHGCSEVRRAVRFGFSSIRELGFSRPPSILEIYGRIKELHHSFCEFSDGPEIMLQAKHLVKKTMLVLSLPQFRWGPRLFVLEKQRKRYSVDTYEIKLVDDLPLDTKIIFRIGSEGKLEEDGVTVTL